MPLIPDKFSLQINMGTVILSLIMTIGGGMTGKFGYKGADEAVVQVAIMILVGMYSIYAAKTSEYNSDRKLEQMTQAQEKTENLLQSVSSMSEISSPGSPAMISILILSNPVFLASA